MSSSDRLAWTVRLAIHVQHESPGEEKESNWLPAPDGPFTLGLRMYWPKQAAIDGTWGPPPVTKGD